MRILFDTNVFRDVQRGTISLPDVDQAIVKLKSLRATGVVSPLSLIELGSHLRDDESDYFQQFRDAFQAVVNLCQEGLLDPESFLRKEVFGHPTEGQGLAPQETMEICRTIAAADTYEELVRGKVMSWNGILSKVSFNAGYLHRFREDYEGQYVADMHAHVVKHAIPNFEERRAAGNMAYIEDPVLRAQITDFIDSERFESLFYRLQAVRVDVVLSGEFTDWDKTARSKIEAFSRSYRWVLRKIVESGYNPAKHKNDFNDLHFLVYLADPQVHLITRDGGIGRKVGAQSSQGDRIHTFEEWLGDQ